jgi:tRNA pseudouridine55 synthase
MDGILNINKPGGLTSHDVVAQIRRLLHQKRVGHAGTLDPLASGVLPICVGQATRLAEYASEGGKAYRAELTLGCVTDTYDREGRVLSERSVPELTPAQIEEALQQFRGLQMQVPPPYSAVKLQGQPAYKRARAGQEVRLAPRPIVIARLDLLAWERPQLTLEIECSKGTYIRSLAYDLGECLGCGAHLSALVRTRSGPFTLDRSVTLEQLEEAASTGEIKQYLYPPDSVLQRYPALCVDETNRRRVLHGNSFRAAAPEHEGDQARPLARVYDPEGRFLAVAAWERSSSLWQPVRVFLSQEEDE